MNLNNSFDLVRHVETILLNMDRSAEEFTISHEKRELHVIASSERGDSYSVHSFFWSLEDETPSGSLCYGHYDCTRDEARAVLREKSRHILGG